MQWEKRYILLDRYWQQMASICRQDPIDMTCGHDINLAQIKKKIHLGFYITTLDPSCY